MGEGDAEEAAESGEGGHRSCGILYEVHARAFDMCLDPQKYQNFLREVYMNCKHTLYLHVSSDELRKKFSIS